MTLPRHVGERCSRCSRSPCRVTRGRYGDMPVLLASPARMGWTIRAPRWPRRRLRAHGTSVCTCSPPSPSSVERADWRRCRESPNVPRKCRRGRGPRLPPTGSASTAWRASVRPSWAPIHSDLHPHPYGGRIAVAERHWDGSARRQNVDSVTARVGDRQLHPRAGSGGPGDV